MNSDFMSFFGDTLCAIVFWLIIWSFCFLSMYSLKRFVFLENNTKEQKKKIKRMFLIAGISSSVFGLAVFVSMFAMGTMSENNASIFSYVYWLCLFLYIIIPPIIGVIANIYSSVTARTRAKWLGLFSWIPLVGYFSMLDVVEILPLNLIALDANNIYYKLYQILIYSSLTVFVYWFFYSKRRLKFLQKIEIDIKDRSLSVREEVAIWLLGIWLLIYSSILRITDLPMPDWIRNIEMISNFVLGIVITAFVVGNSYRKYYYEKNIKYQKTLITTMANLVESRDDNTGGHIHRTAKYVEIIARKLQKEGKFKELLTDSYIEDMVIAAPLHDVGKIHISDVVLNKPGKFTDEEFAQMKTHSAAGGEIIDQVEKEVGETISYLDIAKEMAEYHHERMDGKGYPHAIKGEEIPLCARILAVADVFDALISKRCYKDAMPLDKAFAIIKEETGDHFDEDIANAFLASRDEVEQFLSDISEETKVGNVAEATN